ncbi:MAG: phospholipase D-like domain-containing protein [Candidatus Magnetoovum sp. WYHC-5]|nr:phospholipase D-like domain-containing protein [Candidatus Magnetoovum sp. WYHC-5]
MEEFEGYAEEYCHPSYKWIGHRRSVKNIQQWEISNFAGGIGFAFNNYADHKALRVILKVYREDGVCEQYIMDGYCCGEWSDNWQKWQVHQLPLFPYEGLHGLAHNMKFSYIIHKDGKSIPSKYNYKFASLPEFQKGSIPNDDFHDSYFKDLNDFKCTEMDQKTVQDALVKINTEYNDLPIRPFFTRGNTWEPDHPIHEIHKMIDWVIDRKEKDPKGRHYIYMAIFDFDNYHVAEHLIHAQSKGVDIECIADWAAVSPMTITANVAKMKRSGIPIYGVVRNTPGDPSQGIASMHTKIIIFDGEVVHSSSYNLHFHLWGGNWENGIFYYSKDFADIYLNVYYAIRGGIIQRIGVNPEGKYNMFYTFGSYYTAIRDYYRPQDAIITEINNARQNIVVSMFDIGYMTGVSSNDHHETDVITALVNARNRGVRVRVVLNGMIAHTGDLPEPWDTNKYRPLKEAVWKLKSEWMEVAFVYYWESIYSPIHHKFAVIDNYTVITESFNWYLASVHSDEVLSVIRDSRVASAFLDEVDKIFARMRIGWD